MYKVMKKFAARGPESQVGSFKTSKEAQQFIQEKLAEDANIKVNAIYALYEGFDLMEEFDQSKLVQKASSDEESQSGGGGKGSGQRFSPSPFNTAPQPKGMPQSWVKDDEDNKDKK